MAVDDHGNMYTWGANDKGQLGNESTSNSNVPVLFTKNKYVSIHACTAKVCNYQTSFYSSRLSSMTYVCN